MPDDVLPTLGCQIVEMNVQLDHVHLFGESATAGVDRGADGSPERTEPKATYSVGMHLRPFPLVGAFPTERVDAEVACS